MPRVVALDYRDLDAGGMVLRDYGNGMVDVYREEEVEGELVGYVQTERIAPRWTDAARPLLRTMRPMRAIVIRPRSRESGARRRATSSARGDPDPEPEPPPVARSGGRVGLRGARA